MEESSQIENMHIPYIAALKIALFQKFKSLRKTTKLILLDSLIQETIENEFIKFEIYLEICERTLALVGHSS